MAGFKQVAFNWQIFMRAVNRTRPIFLVSLVNLGAFLAITVPLVLTFGLTGYALGSSIGLVIQLGARTYFLRGLFPRFRAMRQLARAVAPTVPAAAVVLGVRLIGGPEQTLRAAVAMLVLYVAVTVLATWVFERALVSEVLGYVRGRGGIRTRAASGAPSSA
jgi:O-antigen/teichoic acid export membrane protein